MGRIITKNRDPRVNEFGPDDFVLNTKTGDLFAKAKNQLFKLIGRSQFDQSTTDNILKLLSEANETNEGVSSAGFRLTDGFYSLESSSPLTGSNVSLHSGIPLDYGQPLPNSPYIKSNGGFNILMDNDNGEDDSSFRVFKDTGVAGVSPGVELMHLDNEGNLSVHGTISGSSITNTEIDGGSF